MFLPNTTGMLSRHLGTNRYAEPTFAPARRVDCAIVNLAVDAAKTSVRSDSSASRGHAEEKVAAAKILFPAVVAVGIGDRFAIQGFELRAFAVQPRLNIMGRLDHHEVTFEIWESAA